MFHGDIFIFKVGDTASLYEMKLSWKHLQKAPFLSFYYEQGFFTGNEGNNL